ncbi:tripartite tricarboxylate transporter substrate-binding protein [Variovorax sp. NFACC27]|uniref:Bug family tripartite tricarboxylate transporter substrate binding protein n=1 Tax=unclassified Variovorax TaxID=663243 RepID=UPI00089AD032|nr:tripartite tricarboxylate transporter substrate-binding protein [Variovorax sp. YR750]MDP9604299.1 tripartite-type tricarboxylate transporter receptor subunit TctC [Variovorax paradoxus]SEF27300.1 Tripartite-type tricarboxylate transporter, receptor component TctC [Variovorax sp. NFACC28]SEG65390.1 Tripartite-type tricarboxylate transporter, receptor component TctC [Variovorax sp. NFACC29]SFC68678.1 Tripartite-type tricarboxylate transporter, receptor component TctC [Variovorax sp. NFACC26]
MPTMNRRAFVASGSAVLLASSVSPAWAAYPDKPVKLVVPWAAGGSTDAIARAMAQRMSQTIGSPVIVDNKPGAAGMIGTDAAAKAAPDGYTIAIVELPHAIAPAVTAKLPYDLLRDFTPVTMIGTSPLVFFAGMGDDSKDFKTFLKTAAAAAAKGAPPAIAHSGAGTVSHLAGELLANRTKIPFNMVPYRGSAPALTDVAAGTVAGHFATLASGSSLLGANRIRPLLVTSTQRVKLPGLQDVPALAENGLRGLEIDQWWAMVAPATTPLDVIEKLRREAIAALEHPSVKERLSVLGVQMKGSTPAELRAFLRSEADRWQKAAHEIGLQPQ